MARIIALVALAALGSLKHRSTVATPMSANLVTVRNLAKSVEAYVRGDWRRGLPRPELPVECDAPNAPNIRGRQRLGE
jgi:hypothetical protein